MVLAAWGQTGPEPPQGIMTNSVRDHLGAIVVQLFNQAHRISTPNPQELQALVESAGDQIEREQAGCPVQIVQASFERPGQLMLTAQSNSLDGPSLNLNYRNASGKDIDSVTLTGWLKIKENPYQLDYTTHPFTLELSKKSLLGKDVEANQALRLASNAFGFDKIELSQVIYADGTTWKPTRKNCAYRDNGGTVSAKAW
jgi:hypothetical protein